MTANTRLVEVQTLLEVSASLSSLADKYPAASEALLALSHNVRDTAVLLEVLVTTRMRQAPGPQ